MKKLCIALILLIFSIPARSEVVFFTFSQWELLTPASRDLYVAGAIDSMIHFAFDPLNIEVARRNGECLTRARITNSQLSVGILELAKKDPQYRSGKVQAALIQYISDLCPDLLGPKVYMDLVNKFYPTPPSQ